MPDGRWIPRRGHPEIPTFRAAMIRKTTISHKRGTVTIRELTVRQIRDLLADSAEGGIDIHALSMSTGMSPERLARIGGPEDLARIWRAFFSLHKALFDSPGKAAPGGPGGKPTFEKTAAVLDERIFRLIEAGHPGVMDYGYSFFLSAMECSEALKKQRMLEMSMMIRAAHHASDKHFKQFAAALK